MTYIRSFSLICWWPISFKCGLGPWWSWLACASLAVLPFLSSRFYTGETGDIAVMGHLCLSPVQRSCLSSKLDKEFLLSFVSGLIISEYKEHVMFVNLTTIQFSLITFWHYIEFLCQLVLYFPFFTIPFLAKYLRCFHQPPFSNRVGMFLGFFNPWMTIKGLFNTCLL